MPVEADDVVGVALLVTLGAPLLAEFLDENPLLEELVEDSVTTLLLDTGPTPDGVVIALFELGRLLELDAALADERNVTIEGAEVLEIDEVLETGKLRVAGVEEKLESDEVIRLEDIVRLETAGMVELVTLEPAKVEDIAVALEIVLLETPGVGEIPVVEPLAVEVTDELLVVAVPTWLGVLAVEVRGIVVPRILAMVELEMLDTGMFALVLL